MALFRKPRSPFWWYSITFEGKRYRASTGKTTKAAANTVEAAALTSLSRGEQGFTRTARGITLRGFSERFLEWVKHCTNLDDNTRRYYRYGWRLLSFSNLASLRVDAITRDDIECTTFQRPVIDRRTHLETAVIVDCSPTYTAQALRTLKVMLGKAEEWKVIARRPKFAVRASPGRDQLIDGGTEASFELALTSPVKNARIRRNREQAWIILAILQDTGMRPDEVFPMRIEHLDRKSNRIWVPSGKTSNSRRFVGMSQRMRELLDGWCGSQTEGWIFPSSRSASGHVTTIAKGFRAARERQGIDSRVVPYSARHTYGTYTMGETKNTFAVSKSMGHADIKSMEPYQHPELTELNQAIDRRNQTRDMTLNSGHTFGHTSKLIQ